MTATQALNSRKNRRSPMVCVPEAMKARIERLRDEMVASYEAGRGTLPDGVTITSGDRASPGRTRRLHNTKPKRRTKR